MSTDSHLEPLRVVVVDDEDPVRTLLRLTLNRSGRAIVVGESDGTPSDVLDACRTQPDVVLLDQHLRGLRGTDLIGDISRIAPSAMVAMLTALDARSEEAAALSAGAFVFYEKAVIATTLIDCLFADHELFRSALAGREVYAPSALSRRITSAPDVD
jgi:two-component system, NarL family, nitrate/nitrite response regulator NarL